MEMLYLDGFHFFVIISENSPLTTHIEDIGIVCSLKLASRAPFREYTHSCVSAANTKQLLSFACRRMSEDLLLTARGNDSTCWTIEEIFSTFPPYIYPPL